MDDKAYSQQQISGQLSLDNVSWKTHQNSQFNWCKIPGLTSLDEVINSKTWNMVFSDVGLGRTAISFEDQRASDYMKELRNVQSVGNATPEGYINQKMAPNQLQNYIPSETFDTFGLPQIVSHISATTPFSGLSYDFCNRNVPVQQIGCITSIARYVYDSGLLQKATAGCTVHKRASLPASNNQFTWENCFSTGKMSSISVCSDDNGCHSSIPSNGDPNVRGLPYSSVTPPEKCFPQNYFDWDSIKYRSFLENHQADFQKDLSSSLGDNLLASTNMRTQKVDSWRTHEVSDICAIFNTSQSQLQSRCSEMSKVPLVWNSAENYEWHNQNAEQQAYKTTQICLEKSNEVQNVVPESYSLRSGSVGIDEWLNSIRLLFREVIYSYIMFKNVAVPCENIRIAFLKHMHSIFCSGHICSCNQYDEMVSHFENCSQPMCNLCVSAREPVVISDKALLASQNATDDLSRGRDYCLYPDTVDRMLPPLKRAKIDHFVPAGIGASHAFDSSVDQLCGVGQPVCLNQWDQAHLTDMHNGLSRHSENYGVARNQVEDILKASVNRDCNDPNSITVGDLNMGNPFPFEFGVSSAVGASEDLPCATSEPLYLEQGPEAILFSNVDVMKVNNPLGVEQSENPGITGYDFMDNAQIMSDSSILNTLEELTVPSEEENIKSVTETMYNGFPGCYEQPVVTDHKEVVNVYFEASQTKSKVKGDSFTPCVVDTKSEKMSTEPKILGVSLVDFFTEDQMKEHISSCRRWKHQGSVKKEFEATGMNVVDENLCQLCFMNRLVHVPIPVYCSCCGNLIKRKLIYYWALDEVGLRQCFCTKCFRISRGGNISFNGVSIPKAKLQKEMNDKEVEESWVQCDKCKSWQHQLCALYNDRKDLEGKAEYICPKCFLKEIESGKHMPLPKTMCFSAKDLPSTILSDHIEQRLYGHLKQERQERANFQGKNPDEVLGAKDLVVRVVLSVDKRLEVKREFLDIIHGESYPSDFLYRSKVILLFQKIEGVDVCIFGMYVQEFGSECGYPNQRCVYISYLDSVKYFRPDIKTVTGEALRTNVYHEILIGYLDYCKKQGFTTCYIWACPPVRGEDYILYCHPAAQRTPKSDKLRKWYKSMLSKAAKENVVVGCTNIYDHLIAPDGVYNRKITAARLPYFDGDYWSNTAECISKNIEKLCKVGLQKKVKKLMTMRTLKSMGRSCFSDTSTKDLLVMEKLGHTILPAKEDFIVVHLQFSCSQCHEAIISGSRWFCPLCRSFHLCSRCLDKEPNLGERITHTSTTNEKHDLSQVWVGGVPHITDDKDAILENSFFENRHAFLAFCQSNHYQFATLRHAKHSSMMILHHLHNPVAFTVQSSCNICRKNVAADHGWHCETCAEYKLCEACYQRNGYGSHIHKLSQCASMSSCGTRKVHLQENDLLQERRFLDVLMHASQCRATKAKPCSFPTCLQIRKLFHHAAQCNVQGVGGCTYCMKTWFLLQLHSRNCDDSHCRIPRCMDIKKHLETSAS